MKGIEAKFAAVIARAPRQQTSRNGIEWTRIQCDIPVRKEDGTEVAYWCNVSVPGNAGHAYMHLAVGDRILAEGSLILNSYERAGKPVIGITLLAKRITLLESAAEEPAEPVPAVTAPPSYRQDKLEHRSQRRRHREWAD